MLRRQCALHTRAPAPFARGCCRPGSTTIVPPVIHSLAQYRTLPVLSNLHPSISISKPPPALRRAISEYYQNQQRSDVSSGQNNETQLVSSILPAQHAAAIASRHPDFAYCGQPPIPVNKSPGATPLGTTPSTEMLVSEGVLDPMILGRGDVRYRSDYHARSAIEAHVSYDAECIRFEAALNAFHRVRECKLDIMAVLGQSRDDLDSLRRRIQNSPTHSPDVNRLSRGIKKRDMFYVWLQWDRVDAIHDRELMGRYGHGYRECYRHLNMRKAALEEKTYAVWTSRVVMDLKANNVADAALETVVAMKHLASLNLTHEELAIDMEDPANPNPRIFQGVKKLTRRQIVYRRMVDEFSLHYSTISLLEELVKRITVTLMELDLLQYGLLGLMQAKFLLLPFKSFNVETVRQFERATQHGGDMFPVSTSDPRLLEIEKQYRSIMRSVYEGVRPMIDRLESELHSRIGEVEASGALVPYTAKIQKMTLQFIKLNHLRRYQETTSLLCPFGYNPSKRYRQICLRTIDDKRKNARISRQALRSAQAAYSLSRSSEQRAFRRAEIRRTRDSLFAKITEDHRSLRIKKHITKWAHRRGLSRKEKADLRGDMMRRMVVSRRELHMIKSAAFDQSVKIRKHWNLKSLVRYYPTLSRPELRAARKRCWRKRWMTVIRRIKTTRNLPDSEEEWTLANIVLHIPERTHRLRGIRRILYTPLFSLSRRRRRREMRALLRDFPPIIQIEKDSSTLLLPNTNTTLGKVCGILGFDGPTLADGVVKSDDVSGFGDIHDQAAGGTFHGRGRLKPTLRMWAPHPVVCFAESQTAHCASGGPESETGANSSPAIPDCSVASSINFDNDMHTQEEQFPCTNNDASQEFDYAGDGEEEQAFSNESDAESAVDHDHETHIPLSFQIPLDVLRTAMQASPSSQAAYYSHRLYRGPEDQALSVHYCRNMEVAEKVAKYFVDDKVLGFDIEWKPWSSATSIKGNASLIQIASEDRIALFHISLFDGETADELMPPTLKAILASPRIYKVGVAIKGDFSRLEKHLGVKARGVFEISRLHNLVEHYATDPSKINKRLVSLANQTKQHLQLPLFKGEVRESDWSKPLTPDQIQYAATDAYAGLRIFDVLEYKRKLLKPTPPIPDTCDVDVPTIRRLNAKSAMAMAMAKEKARKAAEEIQQDDEDSDAYQTAPEELMDSHELEDLSDSASSGSYGRSESPDADYVPRSQRSSPVPVDLSTHPQLKARRVGRLDFSRLKGVDPGYPILPRPRSEDENESDSSVAFDPPPKSRLRRRVAKNTVSKQVSQPVDTDAEMDESADKELEERLSTMQIDDLSATDGGKYGSGSGEQVEDEQRAPLTTQAPVLERDESGEWKVVIPAEPPMTITKDKKRRKSTPMVSIAPQSKPLTLATTPRSPEYMAAETWAQSYLVQTIPSAASSSVASPPSKIRATVPHLRAYHLWHHQCLSLENIAGQLREPPLSLTTVMSYITQAVDLEKLEYRRDDMKEVLRGMPIGLRMGRYRRLMERVGGLY